MDRLNDKLEENYENLKQKLQSVYNSAKTKNGVGGLDAQKEEFMNLFYKAFDWNTDYDEEGLQFVHDNDDNENDDNENDDIEEIKNDSENDLNVESETMDNKEKPEAKSETSTDGLSVNVKESANETVTSTDNVLTPRARLRLEHGSFSNSKPSSNSTGQGRSTANKSDGNKSMDLIDVKDSIHQVNGHVNQDDASDTTNQATEDTEIEKNNVHQDKTKSNAVPNLAEIGNVSEVVKLLAGDSGMAFSKGLLTKIGDWHKQNSNQSWVSDFSDWSDLEKSAQGHETVASQPKSENAFLQNNSPYPFHVSEITKNNDKTNVTKTDYDSTTVEADVVRRVLRELILVLLAYHPNGVYESELQEKYNAMNEHGSQIDDNIQYLFLNHRCVLVTPSFHRGNLLTLNHQSIQGILKEYTETEISKVIAEHVNVVIRLFPCGVSFEILDEMFSNFYGYKLSQVFPHVKQFLKNHCNVALDSNERVLLYLPFAASQNEMDQNNHQSQVLSSAIGYRELLIALLAHHENSINVGQLESEFRELFGMPLNACSPVINRILKKINDPSLNQEQKSQMLHPSSQLSDEMNAPRCNLRNNGNNTSKAIITQFRLGSNFELHYEKNLSLFEIFCPNCRQDNATAAIKSPFKEDHRIVFMGGFAYGTSTKELEDALAKYDAKMVDCKGISFRNYGWSFVKLETPQQAEDLIARSPIQIRGRNIDVRPFIDRRRVKNHQQNRPTPKKLLTAVLEAVQQNPSGLTVAQIQTNLFHKFQFRVDGPEITKLVSKNAKLLQIKRHPVERIVLTPKMHQLKTDELKWKVLKIWNSSEGDKDKTDETGSNIDDNGKIKNEKLSSLSDFENEFARRYKASLDPKLYGFDSLYELLQSISDCQLDAPPMSQTGTTPPFSHLSTASAVPSKPLTGSSNARNIVNNTVDKNNYSRNSQMSGSVNTKTTSMLNSMERKNPTEINGNSTMHMLSNGFSTNGSTAYSLNSVPVYPQYSSFQLTGMNNNTRFPIGMPMYPGQLVSQTSDMEIPYPAFENLWSFQNVPAQQSQQSLFLPSFSNLGAFSNRSLENFSTGINKPNIDTNQSTLALLNQFSNGSQFGMPARPSG